MKSNRSILLTVIAVAALVLSSMTLMPASRSVLSATAGEVHFTASGDFAAGAQTTAVLNQINTIQPDLHLALGDLSYGTTGQEQTWCDFVHARVGATFPFELVSGNHESNGQNGNINDFSACMPNQLPGVVGTYGREWYVDVPQTNPIARFIMISPNVPFTTVGNWSYAQGTSHYNWTETAIDSARTKSIPWVIVGMHKPCLSLGEYACEPGTDIFNLLLDKKVDLVLTGHEHLYQRTHQLAKSAGCASIVPGTSPASGCIADNDSNFAKGSGTIFATVGTGGINLRDVSASDPEAGYFAASSGLNSNATWGSLNVVATSTTLNANFSRASGGTFTDSFRIDPPVAQPNVPPVARITKSCQGLTCTIDGRTSSDSDGSIVSYAWQLGDGATDSRDNFSHTYGSPGTYPISLTVTDDDGATHLVNDVVTVANPTNQPPTAVASVSCAALTCTANGGGSTDPDGTIVGYAWNFGDGSTGTGATAPHTYASAGTYSVTLTVTDNAGGTGTSTASAQPTSPPTSLASDAFARTLASGWGSADVGGSWSTVGSSYSVADGVGRISVAAGSGRSAVLSQVSSNNTDLSFSLVSNKAITGSGLYVAAIGRSISNAGDYRAKARLMSNGTIGLSLTRNNAAGTETIILAESTVAGLQFAAGDRLYVRVQVSGVSPTTVRAKMWKQGQTEPVTWARSVTDTTAALQGAGTVGLYYYLSSGATNGPVTLSLDDFLANSP